MHKIKLLFVFTVFIAQVFSQRFILPTYKPPPKRTVIRTVRSTDRTEPQWLYKGDNIPRAPSTGDHPFLPKYIDDVKLNLNRRHARSADRGEPLWLYQGNNIPRAPATGDHPVFPKYIDDIKLDPNRRYARSADHGEPLWLYQGDNLPRAPATGDHPFLPKHIDDIKVDPNRRYARSLGYIRSGHDGEGIIYSFGRNQRSIRNPWSPSPTLPRPSNPFNPFPGPTVTRRPYPIYAK